MKRNADCFPLKEQRTIINLLHEGLHGTLFVFSFFTYMRTQAPVVDRSWCRCRSNPLPGAASFLSDM